MAAEELLEHTRSLLLYWAQGMRDGRERNHEALLRELCNKYGVAEMLTKEHANDTRKEERHFECEASAPTQVALNGGKQYLADKLIKLMPRHRTYVEPYAGGLAVLLARDPDDPALWLPPDKGCSEVVNDRNRDLTNFWWTLQDEDAFASFSRIVSAVPFSGVEYESANTVASKHATAAEPDVSAAVDFFIKCRQSLAGRMREFTAVTTSRLRGGMNAEVNAWLGAVEGLPAVHERLKRVLILPPTNALEVIEKYDKEGVFFYLDPPYMHETRATTGEYGENEMSPLEHGELLRMLGGLKHARFMLSGYACELYDRHAEKNGWRRVDLEVPNQASHQKTKRRMVEVVWMNY